MANFASISHPFHTLSLLPLLFLLPPFPSHVLSQNIVPAQTSSFLTNFYQTCNLSTSSSSTNGISSSDLQNVIANLQNQTSTSLYGNVTGTIYAMYQCRGDLTLPDCGQCVREASRFAVQNCTQSSTNSDALSAYVLLNGCVVRFQETSFFDLDTTFFVWGCDGSLAGAKSNIYAEYVRHFLDVIVPGASLQDDLFKASLITDGHVSVYGLAQCMSYLSSDQCSYCLSNLADDASSRNICKSDTTPGVRAYYPSCFFRYDDFPFFEERSSLGIDIISINPTRISDNDPFKAIRTILGVTGGAVAAVVLIALFVFICCKRIRTSHKSSNIHVPTKCDTYISGAHQSEIFPFDQLKVASCDFRSINKLGEGAYGPVYKGVLSDGREVAIKKLHVRSQQGEREFLNEVNMITTVQHRNLIQLYGCCAEGPERLLVYEYLKHQSLDKHLFDDQGLNLSWHQRCEIIIGIARGLAYLHEDSRVRIIHRDIKPSNILLDDNLIPKIADFGLARLFPSNETHLSTKIAGTFGYLAPEYVMQGLLSEKHDIYGFGLVALEMLSGRRNIDTQHSQGLLDLAWRFYNENGDIKTLVDPKLHGECARDEAEKVIQIALLCLQEQPEQRPPMSKVVIMLSEHSYGQDRPMVPSWVRAHDNTTIPMLSSTSLVMSPR